MYKIILILISFVISACTSITGVTVNDHCPLKWSNDIDFGDNCKSEEYSGIHFITCEKNDKKNGISCTYEETGILNAEEHYKDDELHGVKRLYFYDGTLLSEETFIHNNKTGDTKKYYESGVSEFSGHYENNLLVNGIFYTKDGKAFPLKKKQNENLSGFIFKTNKFIIQLEPIRDRYTYTYRSWPIDNCCETPDLEIKNGTVIYEGSGGSRRFEFQNNEYKYVVDYSYLSGDITVTDGLTIYKNNEKILYQPAKLIQ